MTGFVEEGIMGAHRYDVPLHRNLQSSARWHGRRVGEAIRGADTTTASYEELFARNTAGCLSPIESADYWYLFDLARSRAIRGIV